MSLNKDYFYIFILSLLLYLPLFLRNNLVPFFGGDPYYYLNSIIHNTPLFLDNLFNVWFFSLFPANIFLIKLIMLLFTFLCGVVIYKIINLFNKKNSLIGVGLFFSLIWFNWIFLKFENDLFGFLFILLAFYFLLKYRLKKFDHKFFNFYIISSLVFLFIGTVGFWGFGIFYIYLFLFISGFHILYIFGCLSTLVFLPKLISRLLPNFVIAENQILVGGLILLFLLFLYLKKNRIKCLWFPIVIGSILATINLKFIYVVIPILLVNISQVKITKPIKSFLILLILFGFITTIYQSIFIFPSYTDYEVFRVAQSSEVCNEKTYYSWSTGYVVQYWGVDTNHYGTPPPNQKKFYKNCVYTLVVDPNIKNCRIHSTAKTNIFSNFNFSNFNSGIFICDSA